MELIMHKWRVPRYVSRPFCEVKDRVDVIETVETVRMERYNEVLNILENRTTQWYSENGYYTSEHRQINKDLSELLVEHVKQGIRPVEFINMEPVLDTPKTDLEDGRFRNVLPSVVETNMFGQVVRVENNPEVGDQEYCSFPVSYENNKLLAKIICATFGWYYGKCQDEVLHDKLSETLVKELNYYLGVQRGMNRGSEITTVDPLEFGTDSLKFRIGISDIAMGTGHHPSKHDACRPVVYYQMGSDDKVELSLTEEAYDTVCLYIHEITRSREVDQDSVNMENANIAFQTVIGWHIRNHLDKVLFQLVGENKIFKPNPEFPETCSNGRIRTDDYKFHFNSSFDSRQSDYFNFKTKVEYTAFGQRLELKMDHKSELLAERFCKIMSGSSKELDIAIRVESINASKSNAN